MKNRSSSRPSSRPAPPAPHRAQGGRPQPSRQGGAGPRREPEIPKSWRWVAGRHAITEALNVRPRDSQLLWLRQGWESSLDLRELEEVARRLKVKIEVKPPTVLDRFCGTHQGALLAVSSRPVLDMEGLKNFELSTVLALDGLEDPHNLGAILRTAWLSGVHGLLIPEDRAVGLTATVHKVACGGVEHVPVLEANQFAPTLESLKEQGYWVFGLSHKAKNTLFEMKLPEKVVWAVGAEDKGLRTSTERLCDELVSIPQVDAAASYNASVAVAMALTETTRQHRHRA